MAKVPELSTFLELLQEVRSTIFPSMFSVAVMWCTLMCFEVVARTTVCRIAWCELDAETAEVGSTPYKWLFRSVAE
jgi:hypothetical protein